MCDRREGFFSHSLNDGLFYWPVSFTASPKGVLQYVLPSGGNIDDPFLQVSFRAQIARWIDLKYIWANL